MIENIQITNFKSIKHLDLTLNDINIFIGANGVGKSNFLSFFLLLKSLKENQLNTYVAKQGYMDNLIFFGEKEHTEIVGKVEFLDETRSIRYRYIFNLLSDNKKKAFIRKEVSEARDERPDYRNWKNSSTNPIPDYESFILTQSTDIRDKNLQLYFDSFKVYHFHDTSDDSPLNKIARTNDNVFLRENGENLPAFLYFLQEKHPKKLRIIERVIASIAPFFESFNLKPDRLNEEFIRLEWKEKGFDRYQNAQNLSDGTLRFIALTTLLLQPNPPKTIIIDEPELGLHPSAINKLAGLVKKASAHSQIILSTQSVDLINNFEPEDIITVDRDRRGHQSIFKRLDVNELSSWLETYNVGELWLKSVIGGQP
ncbi:MAG: AAA family ATPase [Saprospiraceae bacterium]